MLSRQVAAVLAMCTNHPPKRSTALSSSFVPAVSMTVDHSQSHLPSVIPPDIRVWIMDVLELGDLVLSRTVAVVLDICTNLSSQIVP